MAKMIPNNYNNKNKSNAEEEIFNYFKEAPKTNDWVVFHSFGISDHIKRVYGEIDFLVLAPNLGIFILEVKGGRVRREEGVWIFTDRYDNEYKRDYGPFDQAKDCMYSIIDNFKKLNKYNLVENFLFGYGAMFPDIEYDVDDFDYNQEQVFDFRDKGNVVNYIKRLSDYFYNKIQRSNSHIRLPSKRDIDALAKELRKDFDIAIPLENILGKTEKRIVHLTKEQYNCLDGLYENKRCLINGAAGTGKTILSLKFAKESQDKKIGFFVYNKLLALYLKEKLIDETNIIVDSFTDYLYDLVNTHLKVNLEDYDDLSMFYREELPFLAIDVIEKQKIKFDLLILDEAQDLITENFLLVMDVLLVGGLKEGNWFFFGDFKNQGIFNKELSIQKTKELLKAFDVFYTNFKLTKNLRNSIPIQKEMEMLMKTQKKHSQTSITSEKVKYITYKNREEAVSLLEEKIDKLIESGLTRKDISIISPYKLDTSIANKMKKYKIRQVGDVGKGIFFSTIQAFKGIENKVIIVVDVSNYNRRELLYVAYSRARSYLIVLESEKGRKERMKLLKKQ